MKVAQFKALLSEQAFQQNQKFPEIQVEAAKRYGLEPLYKRWANCGGVDGFVSEYYKDANDDVVYAIDLCDATVFVKLEIITNSGAKIIQVGYDKGYNSKDPKVLMCEFAEHDCDNGWHIAFTGFGAFMDAVEIEAKAIGRDDFTEAVKAFYRKGMQSTYEECNHSYYFRRFMMLFNESGEGSERAVQLSNARDGKLFGLLSLV